MSVDNILSALTVSSENALHEEGLYDRGQGSVERARGFADFRFLKSFFEESETGEAWAALPKEWKAGAIGGRTLKPTSTLIEWKRKS